MKVAWAGEDRRVGPKGHPANRPEGILLGHRQITVDVPDGYAFELQPGLLLIYGLVGIFLVPLIWTF